jgi:hypothetical protein
LTNSFLATSDPAFDDLTDPTVVVAVAGAMTLMLLLADFG